MDYPKLEYFTQIFGREDFNYVSNLKNIRKISDIMIYSIAYPDGVEETIHIPLLNDYYVNLASFCNWICAESVPDISHGYLICVRGLMRAIELLRQVRDKRVALQSGGYLNKFNKEFLYGLNVLYEGVKTAFDPKAKAKVNINEEQLKRFFLDKRVGFGRKFIFNSNGQHSFVTKLEELSREQLSLVSRLLVDMPINKTRSAKGWTDIGQERSPVRILITNRFFGFGKDAVSFLFLVKREHNAYTTILNTPPNKFRFVPA